MMPYLKLNTQAWRLPAIPRNAKEKNRENVEEVEYQKGLQVTFETR